MTGDGWTTVSTIPSQYSILPLPKAEKRVNAKGRKNRTSAILTDTPIKKMLEEEQERSKGEKKTLKSQKATNTGPEPAQQKRNKKKQSSIKKKLNESDGENSMLDM